jgi:hypothetical protein
MRNGRKIIISTIVSLSAAGSILASSAAAMTATQATATNVVAAGSYTVYYHS